MPGGDRTGPDGLGPMTGRAAGFCAGFRRAGYATPWSGRGWGWRHTYYATGLPGRIRNGFVNDVEDTEEALAYLKQEVSLLQNQIDSLQDRLSPKKDK